MCGEGGSLVRFAVVPLMHGRFFPGVCMSHNSYDLLLLCPRCFAGSRRLCDGLRVRAAEDFGIPSVRLRGSDRDANAKQVLQVREELVTASHACEASHCGTHAGRDDSPEKDCDLHRRVRLQGMVDCLALMQHREVLDKVFSYAKALHARYQSLAQPTGDAYTAPGGEGVAEAALRTSPPRGRRGVKHHRHHTTDLHTLRATVIREDRCCVMADFLREKAPSYPFYIGPGAGNGAAEQGLAVAASGSPCAGLTGPALQSAVFCGGPVSPVGAFFILGGCAGEL